MHERHQEVYDLHTGMPSSAIKECPCNQYPVIYRQSDDFGETSDKHRTYAAVTLPHLKPGHVK